MKKIIFTIALFAISAATSLNAQHATNHSSMDNQPSKELTVLLKNPKVQALHNGMNQLWNAHMYWTLITVDAFFNDPKGLNAKLERLLQNQKDIT